MGHSVKNKKHYSVVIVTRVRHTNQHHTPREHFKYGETSRDQAKIGIWKNFDTKSAAELLTIWDDSFVLKVVIDNLENETRFRKKKFAAPLLTGD